MFDFIPHRRARLSAFWRVAAGLGLALLSSGVPSGARQRRSHTYSIPLPPKPDFSALDWLVGDWSGKTGNPNGQVHLSVAYTLDRRFMVLHEQVTLPTTQLLPAGRETWMGLLAADRSGFTLHLFSNTGFVTRYHVTPADEDLRFNPDGGSESPPGWLFRRIITRVGQDALTEIVQVAPPDGAFFNYYTARLTRTPPAPANAPGNHR